MARIPRGSGARNPAPITQPQETFFCAEDDAKDLCRHEPSGRPLRREPFVVAVEGKLGQKLRRGKAQPKRGRAAQIRMVFPELSKVPLYAKASAGQDRVPAARGLTLLGPAAEFNRWIL